MKSARTQINVHLNFNGNCESAMNFYHGCFGGELSIQLVCDSPMKDQWPQEQQNKVLHAELRKHDLVLMASDMGTQRQKTAYNLVSLALVCKSKREIECYFSRLSVDGTVTHPLHHFFDGTIGALKDKFGLNWILKY